MIAADGEVVWIYDISTEAPADPPAPRRRHGYLVDITSRRRAEEQLLKSEEQYRQTGGSLPGRDPRPCGRPLRVRERGRRADARREVARRADRSPDRRDRPSRLSAPGSRTRGARREGAGGAAARGALRPHGRPRDRRGGVRHPRGVRGPSGRPDRGPRHLAAQGVRGAPSRPRRSGTGSWSSTSPPSSTWRRSRATPNASTSARKWKPSSATPPTNGGWTPDFWIDHVHDEDRPEPVIAYDEHTNAEHRPFSADYRFLAADGGWRWVHDEATFLEGPGGSGFWQGFIVDITDRKRVEERLREAELKFRLDRRAEPGHLLHAADRSDRAERSRSRRTSPPGDTDAHRVSDPTRSRRIPRCGPASSIRRTGSGFVAVTSSQGGDDHFSIEYRMIRKDGRIVWVQDDAALVQLPGQAKHWQGFLLDVTERKVAEEQLARALEVEREAAQRLRALDEMKNTFLQAVSHDLRTPLAAILGLAVTLERDDVDARSRTTRGTSLAGSRENARKLDRLVDGPARHRPARAGDRVAEARVRRRGRRRSTRSWPTRSAIDRERARRPTSTGSSIPVDASKVERIVENLLANTARHTPVERTRVGVRARTRAGGVLIKVEDDGAGVPREIREADLRAVPAGTRGAPALTRASASDSTLVRRFAELHGGRAWVEERTAAARRSGVPARAAPGRGEPRNRGRVRGAAQPATTGWSTATGPTWAAPPGDPSPLTFVVEELGVDGGELLPLRRHVVLVEDRGDGADRLAGAAVDALVGVDVEHARALVDAVDRDIRPRRRGPSRRCRALRSCRSSAFTSFPRCRPCKL